MIRRLVFLLVVVCLVFMPLRTLNAQDGKKMIEGIWILVAVEVGGQKVPGESFKDKEAGSAAGRLTLAEGRYIFQNDQGTYKLITAEDPRAPKAMDITGTSGPNIGKTFLAIYELTGDSLRICYDLGGKMRPSEFTTKAGTKLFLAIYNRAKA